MHWHILTGEYPPQEGGVADYTRLVAHGLVSQGDAVDIWVPGVPSGDDEGVAVHTLPDHFGARSLALLTRHLRAESTPHRVLVQYVPHAFGWKGSNVPFCLWLRSQTREAIWVMFHEFAFPLGRHQKLMQNGLGVVTRGMAALVAAAAERAFVSIPAWESEVRRAVSAATPVEWMPVPSAIDVDEDPAGAATLRVRYAREGRPLVGHFGTFGRLIAPLLFDALPFVVEDAGATVLLIGRGSERAAASVVQRWPELTGRVQGTGSLDAKGVSHHVAACDVMLQPYPDGVSSRRTSVMVALSHARPVVTTAGALTEQLWRGCAGVRLCPVGHPRALADACASIVASPAIARLGADAAALYDAQFDLRHTIAMLRAPGAAARLRAVS